MDVCAQAVALTGDRERVVVVLRRLRVDGERRQLAEVRAAFESGLGRVVRLVGAKFASLAQEALEHRLDAVGGAEDALHTGAAAPRARDDEVARAGVAESVTVDDDRHAGLEVRLADDQLAALAQLDDDLAPCGRLVTHLARSRYPPL